MRRVLVAALGLFAGVTLLLSLKTAPADRRAAPTAVASFSRVSRVGRVPPPSMRAMADWVVPMRSANSAWVRPASWRSW